MPSSSQTTKLKSTLRLLIPRLRMSQKKDTAVSVAARREMAQLLETGREASARIRVENIIATDITVELMEILELYCELLLARANLLDATPPDTKGGGGYIDPGLEEATASIIYAAPRLPRDVKELAIVRALLAERWGKEFALKAQENRDDIVPERVVKKLRVQPPSQELVTLYLKEIARTYGVLWPKEDYEQDREIERLKDEVDEEDEDADEGGEGDEGGDKAVKTSKKKKVDLGRPFEREELSRATPPRKIGPGGAKSPVSVAPPAPRSDNLSPKVKIPGAGDEKEVERRRSTGLGTAKVKDVVGGKIPDVDELAKRFAALKK